MAGPSVDVGTGAILSFSSTSYTTEVVSMNIAGRERVAVDTTHLGSSAKTYIRGDLVEPGTIEAVINYAPDNPPPIYGTTSQENVIVEFPKWGTQTTGAKDTALGFIQAIDGPNIAVDERMEATLTIKLSGVVTQADGL